MIKSYKIRLFPTQDQEKKMWQHIGASRFIWNYMLAEQQRRYEAGEKHMSSFDMNKLLPSVKKVDGYEWLYDISANTLQRSCADLAKSYDNFFKEKARHPRFKSRKKDRPSFPLRDGIGSLLFEEGVVHLPKLGKVSYKTNYNIPFGRDKKFSNPRIHQNAKGKWILSFGIECESQAPELTDKPMGIDLGIKETATVAFGDEHLVFHNINKSRKVRVLEKRLKHMQRCVSRKYQSNGSYEKTSNIIKQEAKIKKLHARLANIRLDYTHQMTHKLVSLLPCRVIMEDLNVTGMMKNRHLSKAVQQQIFGEFIRQMKYKCEWNSIAFVQVNRFYPSSKTCSACGCIKHNLKLSDRVYTCPECGHTIDRDLNAAINLMRYEA